MIIVRYATLVALVLWLGAMINARFGNLFWRVETISYGCGLLTVVGLFVMKFMGPPPRASTALASRTAPAISTAEKTARPANVERETI